jgi:hypothetical protein
MKKSIILISLIPVLLLSACGMAATLAAPAGSSVNRALDSASAKESFGVPEAQAPAAAPTVAPVATNVAPGSNPTDRIVLLNASLDLVVKDPSDAASKIADMAFAKGGWVVNSNITQSLYGSNGEKYYSGDISIRVPADSVDKLKATLKEIEALAVEVKSRQLSGQDVTAEYTDAQSRLRNLRASQERLLKIMESAIDANAIVAVEAQLREVEGEIEVLEGQINYYQTASQYSLISVALEPYIPSQPIQIGGWHPEGVAKQAVQNLIRGLQGLVDFLIRLGICGIPALLVIALLASPFYLIGRALIRRRRKTKPAA